MGEVELSGRTEAPDAEQQAGVSGETPEYWKKFIHSDFEKTLQTSSEHLASRVKSKMSV